MINYGQGLSGWLSQDSSPPQNLNRACTSSSGRSSGKNSFAPSSNTTSRVPGMVFFSHSAHFTSNKMSAVPHTTNVGVYMPPKISVEKNSVNEQRGWTDSLVVVIYLTERCTDPVEALRGALAGFLSRAKEPEIRRIVLTDAHSVVGWEKWREIEERHGLGLLKMALTRISESGRIAPAMIDVYANIVLASMIEIAFMISRSEDSEAEIQRGTLAMNQLLERLLQLS